MKIILGGVTEISGLKFGGDTTEPLRLALNSDQDSITIERIPKEVSTADGPTPLPEFTNDLRAKVILYVDISDQGYNFVRDLLNDKYSFYGSNPPPLPITRKWPKVVDGVTVQEDVVRVDADGNIIEKRRVPFEAFPDEIKQTCENAKTAMARHIRTTVGLLCWRYALDPGPDLFDFVRLHWGVIEGPLTSVSEYRRHTMFGRRVSLSPQPETHSEIQTLLAHGKSEPLGHELLREAISLMATAPRSCLLIAVSALEAGVKAHIGKQVPNAQWLLEKAPSPPITKMLRQYAKELHEAAGRDVTFWAKLNGRFNDLDEIVKHRNTLAHSGEMPTMQKSLKQYVRTISDVLYVLDVLLGNEWAKECVHFRLKKELLWPGHDKAYGEIASVNVV